MTRIKACIFDLDGVIVDTAKYHYLAWKRLAKELGFNFSESENEQLKGISRMESLEILLDIGKLNISDKEKEQLASKKNKWYVDYIKNLNAKEILPGVKAFLDDLKQIGIKTAIGSASKNARLILEGLGLTSYFEVIIDGTKITKSKPDPEVFLLGAKELGVDASECIVFEDAQSGIEAAKNGGMLCIGIGSTKSLKGADIIIPGFKYLTFDKVLNNLKVHSNDTVPEN